METETKKTITSLTTESVSILTQQFENETQIGGNHRCAYTNTESGRVSLIEREPEDIVAEVLAVWGEEPTVEEPTFDDYESKPTAEERIAELEAQNEMLMSCVLEMSEIVYA